MRKIKIALLLSFFASASMVQAQDTARLDPVTITASLSPLKVSQTGRNVLVIGGEQFEHLPVHSLDELLRYVPGVEVQARGPMGAQSDILLRGGTFQQVLVILDGVRLNDPNTGHFTSYIPIAPAEIERIEVLKGASSAIYGAEAVGGVIQIITKTFAARKGVARSNGNAQLTGGAYGLFSVQGGGAYSNGATTVSGGVLSNSTDGQPQRGTRGSLYNHTASLSASHFLNEQWSLQLRFAYDDRKFSAQNFYTNFISDTANEKIRTAWTQLGIVRQGQANRLSFSAGYKTLDDTYQFNAAGVPNKSNSRLWQALLTDEWQLNNAVTLTTGFQYISKYISSNDRGLHRLGQAATFAVVNTELGERFFASPALRLEWNERSGWELVPQVNLSYCTNALQLRASGGKTIRDADFTERFNNYQKAFVASGRIGNPDLAAERSWSYEAGADYFIAKAWKLSGSFFQRYHTRLIDYVPTPYASMPRKVNLSPTGTYALAKNIAEVTTMGAEADIQYTHRFNKEHELSATLGLLWLESKSSETTPSFYISSHARLLTNFSLQYQVKKFSFGLNGLYKKRQPQTATVAIAKVSPDYFVMNAKLEFVAVTRLSVFAQADNIFNRSYADLLGAQMPGRWLMGGIKISLSK